MFSAILIVIGVVLTLMMALTSDMVEVILPEKYRPFAPLVITFIGIIAGWLRSITNTAPFSNAPPPIPPIPPLPPVAGQ